MTALIWASVPAGATAGRIGLVSGEIDTAKVAEATPQTLQHISAGGRALLIIQFEGPIAPDDLAAIKKQGAQPISYIPDNAYLVSAPISGLSALHGTPRTTWLGELSAANKIHPRLSKISAAELRITILSADDGIASQLRAKGIAVQSSRMTALGWQDTRATIPAGELNAVASYWNVFHIEPQPQYELFGEREAQTAAGQYPLGGTAPSGPGYASWLATNGLTGGAGLIVQVSDDGLDQGIATNLPGTAHPDLLGRIAGIFNPTTDPLGNCIGGHGQINAGIIMGNGSVGTLGLGGYNLGQGVAPQGQVYATKIFRNSGPFDIGSLTFTDLMKNAQDAGAYFSNNSWGEPLFGDYTADAAEFDLLTRDSDPTEAGNQPRVYFFAAGNIGIYGPGTIGSPASAKNVIAVGATENSDADGIDGCFVTDIEADSHRDMAYFSSRGPVADGRIGITVTAPGTHVQGQASTDPGFAGTTVCDPEWPIGQSFYARSSGTSHSTPVVAGAGMIVYEFFNTQLSGLGHTATPSPALIKAVLANTATDMAGADDGFGFTLGAIPSTDQGWGSVNLNTLTSMKESLYSADQEHVFTGSGQNFQKVISIVDPGKPLKITLVWSDAPGNPLATPNLVNDLDLSVTIGATTYRGNVFTSGGVSTTGGTADRLNNIESVYITSPTGPYTLNVDAFNISGDGIPNSGGALEQDFAIFVWNGSNQSSEGIIDLDKTHVNCADTARVLVSDTDLQGTGTLTITVSSSTGDTEPLLLAETSPGTGVLINTITTAAGVPAVDGILQVADGGTITATYNDADDGTGFPAVVADNAAVDCTPPVISNINFTNVGLDTFTVTFDTNELCTGLAFADLACGGATLSSITSLATSHAATFTGLTPCTTYYVRLRATDRANNITNDDNSGLCFSVRTQIATDTFADDFEGTIPGWTSTGLWHKVSPASNFPNSNSPIHAWWYGSEALGSYNTGTNSGSLTSPLIALNDDHFLTFSTWEQTDEFLDSMQVSVQVGVTQTVIYNGAENTDGWEHIGPLDLSAFTGQSIRLIFEFNTFDDFTNDFRGWYVDDIRVFTGEDCLTNLGAVDIEANRYGCGETLDVVVRDLNAPAGPLSVTITTGEGDSEVVSVSDPEGDKFYHGSIPIGANAEPVAVDGRIQGLSLDTITATYNDADDGTATPAMDTDTAQLDCLPPVISGVNFINITDEGFTVRFTTNEAATGAAIAGTVCGVADGSANGPLTNTHALTFTGLQSCTNYFVSLSATDGDGNLGTNNNGGACFLVKTRTLVTSLDDDFEPGAEVGWTHNAAIGPDNWAVRSDGGAHSPTNVYSYEMTTGGLTDTRLISPTFTGGGQLTFWHSYNLEFGFDGAVLELSTNGGASWFDAGPNIVEGGYNGTISDCCGSALQNRNAWMGTQTTMTRVRVNLAAFPGSLKARFRFATDPFAVGDRWLIDDVKAAQIIVCPVNEARNWEHYE